MKRPAALGFLGGPKVGKTHVMSTLFESARVDPTKVLYLDNHGSTDMYDLHQFTDAEPWGVKHIPADDPGELEKVVEGLERKFARKQYPYEAIAVDDWSEFAQAEGEELLEDMGESKMLKVYGELGKVQRRLARILLPRHSHAHLLVAFWASQEPDPLEARPFKVENGEVKYTQDTRRTMLRPFLKGAFAAWFPYKLDALWFQYMEEIKSDPKRKGQLEFYLQLVPDKKAAVLSRWLDHYADGKRPRTMTDPSFDKIMLLIDELEKEKEEIK